MARVKVPYFKWRDGKPRFEPGPGLRARGIAGRDLKDAGGEWLSRGAAMDECERILKAIKGDTTAATVKADNAVRNFTNLIALYKQSPNYLRCAPKTRDGYDSNMGIIEEWCGDTLVAAMTKANIANWHLAQEEIRGASMANALLRMLKILLNYACDDLEWVGRVKARKVKFARTEGRLVIWPMDHVLGYVAWADWAGRPDIGDAVIVGALAGQHRAETLKLPRGTAQGGIYRFKRGKTGREVKVPAVRQLMARLHRAHARIDAAFPNVTHLTELVDMTTGAPFHPDGSEFHKTFHQIKLLAAGSHDGLKHTFHALATIPRQAATPAPLPGLLDLKFSDLRDTAVTWLAMAGCSVAEIATVTGHSLATVQTILDKHYLVRDDAFAHSGGAKLEAYLDEKRFA